MATCPSCRDHYTDDVTSCPRDGSTLVPDAVMAAADTDLRAGEQVGEYRIEMKIGAGGFGAVYRAVHPVIGKTAAVKVLHRQFSSNPQMVSRFIAEAKSVNQIRHKNIIDIFSFGGLADGRQYYVMELLEGTSFERYIKQRGRLSVEEALPILRQIGRALDAAHAAGIVHRDLKPENIFILFDEDGVATPKLLDFGIAKLLGESESGHKTRTGTPMGTPYYMSPEQAHGRAVDHRTDIYSFGVMTHEVLTGRVLFDGESVMDVLLKHINVPPPRVSEVCPELPALLDEPVLRMLAKRPEERPATLADAVDALARAAGEAGFHVSLPVRAGPGAPAAPRAAAPPARPSERGVVITPSGAPSVEPSALAEAQTVIGVHPSLIGASADIPPNRRKRTLLLGAVAVAVVAAGVGLAMMGGGPPSPEVASSASGSSSRPAPSVAAAPGPSVTPGVTAVPMPSAAPSGTGSGEIAVAPAPSASSSVTATSSPGKPGPASKPSVKPPVATSPKPSSDVLW